MILSRNNIHHYKQNCVDESNVYVKKKTHSTAHRRPCNVVSLLNLMVIVTYCTMTMNGVITVDDINDRHHRGACALTYYLSVSLKTKFVIRMSLISV